MNFSTQYIFRNFKDVCIYFVIFAFEAQRLSVRDQIPLLPYRPKSTKKVVELARNNTDAEQSDIGEVLSEKTDDPTDGAFHLMDPRVTLNLFCKLF